MVSREQDNGEGFHGLLLFCDGCALKILEKGLLWPAVRSLKTIQKEKMTIIRSILHFGKEICDVLIKISTIKNYMLIMFKTIKTLAMWSKTWKECRKIKFYKFGWLHVSFI